MQLVSSKEAREAVESGETVLVDFFAPWCGPCNRLAPILEELESENEDIRFLKINVDEDLEFAQDLEVFSLPTLVLFRDGQEVDKRQGLLPKPALISFLSD